MKRRAALGALAAAGLSACQPGADPLAHVSGGFADPPIERGHRLRQPQALPSAPAHIHTERVHTAIIGGGVAGLAAAHHLQQAGVDDLALLELQDQPGGNARSAKLGGLSCPLAAHYLPVPEDHNHSLLAWLASQGLMQRQHGRWRVSPLGERHLCHSPQERLWRNGLWQEGLLPVDGVPPATLAAYRRFAELVRAQQASGHYRIPTPQAPLPDALRALDQHSFAHWLNQHGLHDEHLRWYLDYCCLDDYGAPAHTVSAWAGLHYFASRHGFAPPGAEHAPEAAPPEAVFTWPEGNAWLTQRLAAPLGDRLRPGALVWRVQLGRGSDSHPVQIDWLHAPSGQPRRLLARRGVLATPLFISARLLLGLPASAHSALQAAAAQVPYAPWVVTNLLLDAPPLPHPPLPWHQRLASRFGHPPDTPDNAAPAWDNVPYGSASLGYVDASHQSLHPAPGPRVWTHYRALGGPDMARARRALLAADWRSLARQAVAELLPAHPDLPQRLQRALVTRWGHAMACPVPGLRSSAALAALQHLPGPRLQLAHADLSAYSIFEEAWAQGQRAAAQLLKTG